MIRLSKKEIKILKELAKKVEEISFDKRFKEKEILWKKINSLKNTRPLIWCPPQAGWDEIIDPSVNVVKDELFGYYEKLLRQLIYRDNNLRDDEIISNKIYVPYVTHITDWIENRQRPFDSRADYSGKFHPSIIETSDLQKLRFPELTLDEKASKEDYELAQEVFGDYMDVIQGEPFFNATHDKVMGHGFSLIDIWCELRGIETVYYDLIDKPEFTKEAMQFLMEGTIHYLKQAVKLGIFRLNNNEFVKESTSPCGTCGLACTDQLPALDYYGAVRLKDLWGYCMAQEFHTVSADMLEEFVLPFQTQIADLFGLNVYGCCESNDKKWDSIIKHIPRLRALSVSPYSDLEIAVEKLKDHYVLCWKPKPADMIAAYDPERMRDELAHAMDIAKGTHLVIILREIETVYHDPKRLTVWIDTAMELAQNYAV